MGLANAVLFQSAKKKKQARYASKIGIGISTDWFKLMQTCSFSQSAQNGRWKCK